MISAFKHIRLSGYNLLPQSLDGKVRLSLNNSGVAYFSELSTASGILNTKINDFSGTFQSFVNNLDATYATDAQLIAASGALQTGINDLNALVNSNASTQGFAIGALGNRIEETGAANLARINSLSGYSDAKFATITNLGLTGSTLNTKINSLSGYSNNTFTTLTSFSNFTGNLAATFATDAELVAVSGALQTKLAATGSTLNTKINSLSGNLTSDYVKKATQQQFIVTLPINVESTGITFPVAFASTPNSVQVTFEPFADVAYMVAVKNRTTVGFTAEFSDVLFETGNKLNVFASV